MKEPEEPRMITAQILPRSNRIEHKTATIVQSFNLPRHIFKNVLEQLHLRELKILAEKAGVKKSGRKVDLINRIWLSDTIDGDLAIIVTNEDARRGTNSKTPKVKNVSGASDFWGTISVEQEAKEIFA